MQKELVNPLRLDCHCPLLFLQGFLWGLLSFGSLADQILNSVRVQGVHDPVEEVAIWEALIVWSAIGFRQV